MQSSSVRFILPVTKIQIDCYNTGKVYLPGQQKKIMSTENFHINVTLAVFATAVKLQTAELEKIILICFSSVNLQISKRFIVV